MHLADAFIQGNICGSSRNQTQHPPGSDMPTTTLQTHHSWSLLLINSLQFHFTAQHVGEADLTDARHLTWTWSLHKHMPGVDVVF